MKIKNALNYTIDIILRSTYKAATKTTVITSKPLIGTVKYILEGLSQNSDIFYDHFANKEDPNPFDITIYNAINLISGVANFTNEQTKKFESKINGGAYPYDPDKTILSYLQNFYDKMQTYQEKFNQKEGDKNREGK